MSAFIVRIMSPLTGEVVTTLIMPTNRHLVDAAYAIDEDIVFACFGNGDIIKVIRHIGGFMCDLSIAIGHAEQLVRHNYMYILSS